MISYFFPPLGGVGVQRAVRYVRHLPEFGWSPMVLTVKHGLGGEPLDTESLCRIPDEVPVVGTDLLDVTLPARWLYSLAKFGSYNRGLLTDFPRIVILRLLHYALHRPCLAAARKWGQFVACFPPDHHVGWLPFAYLAARRVLSQETIDVIYTVSAPYTAHLVGYFLKKRTGKPWIADFRDEWTQNPARRPLFRWQGKADRWLEQQVLREADAIVTATGPYKELMSSLVEPNLREKFVAVTNGFEAEDFNPYDAFPKCDKFRVVYCGSFYEMQQPTYFLAAVRSLVEEGHLALEQLSLTFAGYTLHNTREMFKDSVLYPAIRDMGIVPHQEAVRQMRKADVLLLVVSSLRGKENIPAKTFEYIATGKPVLALVPPDGEAARVIQETKTGAVVAPEDVPAIKAAILDLYARWTRGELQAKPNWEQINRYEAREVTRQLSIVLDGLVSG